MTMGRILLKFRYLKLDVIFAELEHYAKFHSDQQKGEAAIELLTLFKNYEAKFERKTKKTRF